MEGGGGPSSRVPSRPQSARSSPAPGRQELRARRVITRNPTAFLHSGPAVVLRRPGSPEAREAWERGAPLTKAELMPESRTRASIKAMVADAALIMAAAAREAAIARNVIKSNPYANEDTSTWTDFDGASLEPLLRVDEALGDSPVRLLDARFLIKLSERGGWLTARQNLPAESFIELDRLRHMTASHTGLRVICVSHVWLQPDHPDPRRTTLALLGRVLKILVEECGGKDGSFTFAVFIDYCCMFHGEALQSQEALFKKALTQQAALFSHPHTWVLKVTPLPHAYPRGYTFRAGTRPNVASYHDRGWTFAESRCAALIKTHNSQVLDLGKWPLAVETYAAKKKSGWLDDDERFTPMGLGCDLETLLEQCTAPRPPPLTPNQFNESLDSKAFTSRGRDLGPVKALYRRACCVMRDHESLDYSQLGWGDAEARQLAKMLGNGWGRCCKRLFVGNNRIGNDGLFALAHALRQGRMRHLESIDLRGNPAGADARQDVRAAADELLASGTMQASEIRVFGTPEASAKLIQRRLRRRFSVLAKAALLSVQQAKEEGGELPGEGETSAEAKAAAFEDMVHESVDPLTS